MAKVLENQTIKIPQKALKKGVVMLELDEYKDLCERAAPTYCLTGKEAKALDSLVEEGLREYRAGKCKKIKSLADLD